MRRATLWQPDAAIHRETRLRISLIGAFFGGIIDSVVTNIYFVIMVVLWLAATPDAMKYGSYQAIEHFRGLLQNDALTKGRAYGMGALGSVIGGYFAARNAKRAMDLTAGLSAWLCIGSALYGLSAIPGLLTHGQLALGAVGRVLCGAAEGYFRQWMTKD